MVVVATRQYKVGPFLRLFNEIGMADTRTEVRGVQIRVSPNVNHVSALQELNCWSPIGQSIPETELQLRLDLTTWSLPD
jgi:hypothetical protein